MEDEKEVCMAIVQILREYFGITGEVLREENWEIHLTSGRIGLSALDLMYLLFEMEKRMGIRISSDSFDNHGCDSILGMAKAVCLAKKLGNYHQMDNYNLEREVR